jgi:S1-C subfamily serine protease
VAPAPAAPSLAERLRAGVVSVRITGQEWNWKTPWAKQSPWSRTLTGLVVSGPRILVASSAVGNQILNEVQKLGLEARTPARLTLADQEGPLALLEVDDPDFWKGLAPLPLAERVPQAGEVTVNRWPRAGQLESSPASVRQVRAGRHGVSRVSLLTLDVASSLEGAGESEVVAAEGMVVALTTGKAGDNTLSGIASPVLRQFLADATSGAYRGFSRAGVSWQELGNPALRTSLGLTPQEGGIRLTRVLSHGSAFGVLQEGDVLLDVGGVPLDAVGQFEHPLYGKMLFPLLFTEGHHPGDELPLRIFRNGERRAVAIKLRAMLPDEDRVPPYIFGRGPDYAVYGGLVFQDLSAPYLSTWGDWPRRAPPRLHNAYDREGAEPTPQRPRLVLLTSVLPDPANLGYQDLRDLLVSSVNGMPIGDLDHLRKAFASPLGGFDIVEFQPGQAWRRIVLDAAEVKASSARVHSVYGVPASS